MFITKLLGHKFREDEFVSCSVSTGGGMTGGSRIVELRREKDGSVTLTVRGREWHYEREEKTVYPASEEAIAHVAEIVNKYSLYAASKRRMSNIEILDGDTTTVSFHFGKRYFSIRQLQRKWPSGRKGYMETIRYLNSLEQGEGVTTREPQHLRLLLHGYNLFFNVEDAWDGKLDEILSEDHEVSRFEDCGIVLCAGVELDASGSGTAEGVRTAEDSDASEESETSAGTKTVCEVQPVTTAEPCDLVYAPGSGSIILLYAEHTFSKPVYLLAKIDGYAKTAAPLVEKMEGEYSFYIN